MDQWQTSVSKRLDSLDGRAQLLEIDVSAIRSELAVLRENVRHLPTKPWMFSTLGGMLGALAVIVGLIVRFVPHAP